MEYNASVSRTQVKAVEEGIPKRKINCYGEKCSENSETSGATQTSLTYTTTTITTTQLKMMSQYFKGTKVT